MGNQAPRMLFAFLLFYFLLYHAACRILVPQPEMEPRPLQWKCGVLSTGLPGKFLFAFFFFFWCQKLRVNYLWFLTMEKKSVTCQNSAKFKHRRLSRLGTWSHPSLV